MFAVKRRRAGRRERTGARRVGQGVIRSHRRRIGPGPAHRSSHVVASFPSRCPCNRPRPGHAGGRRRDRRRSGPRPGAPRRLRRGVRHAGGSARPAHPQQQRPGLGQEGAVPPVRRRVGRRGARHPLRAGPLRPHGVAGAVRGLRLRLPRVRQQRLRDAPQPVPRRGLPGHRLAGPHADGRGGRQRGGGRRLRAARAGLLALAEGRGRSLARGGRERARRVAGHHRAAGLRLHAGQQPRRHRRAHTAQLRNMATAAPAA